MCLGSSRPEVDTSYQDFSIAEAQRARAEEEARQNKINLGMENIRAIFEGGRGVGVQTPAGGQYDPNQTYYNADGSVWTPQAQKAVTDRSWVDTTPERVRNPNYVAPQPAYSRANDPAYKKGTKEYKARLLEEYRAREQGKGNTTLRNDSRSVQYRDVNAGARNAGSPYDDGSYLQWSDVNAGARNPASPYDDGDYLQWIDVGRLNQPEKSGYWNETTRKTGLTAAQQYKRMLDNLLTTTEGPEYAGVGGLLEERRKASEDYYLPQLDKQHADTREDLTFALARAGLLNSTTAETRKADLSEGFGLERAGIMSDIDRDVAQARTGLNQQRSALESTLRASGDAESAIDAALAARSTFAQDQPNLSPLTSTLGAFAQGIGGYRSGASTADIQRRSQGQFGVNRDLGRTVG